MVDLSALTNRELLDVWTGSLDELHARGVVRTYNNPIGDIAEAIVARHYGGFRGTFAQAAWDVAVGEELLQVKACRRATRKTTLEFSPIRHTDGYTALVLVVFTASMRVKQAWRIPREAVNMLAKFNKHVNGLKIGLTAEVMSHPGVERLELNDDAIDASEPISST
ncbi:MAG: hypothetical protein QOG93_1860 [Gaiellaceae bacterium]|nr:hypothetical protein [Gaiellaceae bacterium]